MSDEQKKFGHSYNRDNTHHSSGRPNSGDGRNHGRPNQGDGAPHRSPRRSQDNQGDGGSFEARLNREINRMMHQGGASDIQLDSERTRRDGDNRARRDGDNRARRDGDNRPRRDGDNRVRREEGRRPRQVVNGERVENHSRMERRDDVIRDPRELVVRALLRLDEHGYSNIIWDNMMRKSELNDLDKVLATRIYYGTLSNLRLIDAVWARYEPDMPRRADEVVHTTLRTALYQMMFLDRVPSYSIVSSSVEVVKRLRSQGASGYCNALLRKIVKIRETDGKLEFSSTGSKTLDFAIRYSLNDDLARLLLETFGEEATSIAESMMRAPAMNIRVNQSKISFDEFLSNRELCVEESRLIPKCSCVVQARNQALETAIASGLCCVQDEAAQLAVMALGPADAWGKGQNEVHIWDACAGQGGKTLHLLDLISRTHDGRRYDLLSTDIYANKLERLKSAQHSVFPEQKIIVKVRDLTLPGSVPLAPFDCVLVDAPCSGLGVMRRHPEVKLQRKSEDIQSLAELQAQILDNVSKHLRVGGMLIYAVCTITPQECEIQRVQFLATHPNYAEASLDLDMLGERGQQSSLKLLPSIDGCDGFYIAKFVRVE